MRPPPSFPNGVRTAETITDLAIRSSLAIDDEALQRPEQPPRAPRDRRQPDESVRQGLAAVAPRDLLLRDREPVLVDELDRVAFADLSNWQLEMLRPEALARRTRKRGLAADEVHLCVVEERVLVEVCRADRQPAVVDDPDLRVDVDRLPRGAVPGVAGTGEEPPGAGIGLFEPADLAAAVVVAAVRMGRKNGDDAEVVSRRPAQLLGQDLDELRRPEKLALQVDEPLGRPQRADVALEDAEATAAPALVDVLRDGRHELELVLAGRRLGDRRGQLLSRCFMPAEPEVLGDIGDHRSADDSGGVVPAERRPPLVRARVVAVAAVARQIDAAHARKTVVHHDELLVVAVHGPLLRVERDLDPGAAQPLRELPHITARGSEKRQRRPGPEEHAHLELPREPGEQVD